MAMRSMIGCMSGGGGTLSLLAEPLQTMEGYFKVIYSPSGSVILTMHVQLNLFNETDNQVSLK